MPVYNHGEYLEQAIESVLRQVTKFPYRLIITDDYSTDDSRNIINHYQDNYPDKIEVYYSPKNMGVKHITKVLLDKCKSKYYCILEGDDSWLSTNKIEAAITYLEINPQLSGVFNCCRIEDKSGEFLKEIPDKELRKPIYNIVDILTYPNFIATSSFVFKNIIGGKTIKNRLPAYYFSGAPIGDIIHSVTNAKQGDVGYIDDVMSLYRFQSSDTSYSLKSEYEKHKDSIATFNFINLDLKKQYNCILSDKISNKYFRMAEIDLSEEMPYQAAKSYFQYLKFRKCLKYIGIIDNMFFLRNLIISMCRQRWTFSLNRFK